MGMANVRLSDGCQRLLALLVDTHCRGSDALLVGTREGSRGTPWYNPRGRQARILEEHGYAECLGDRQYHTKAYRATPEGIARHDMITLGVIVTE